MKLPFVCKPSLYLYCYSSKAITLKLKNMLLYTNITSIPAANAAWVILAIITVVCISAVVYNIRRSKA